MPARAPSALASSALATTAVATVAAAGSPAGHAATTRADVPLHRGAGREHEPARGDRLLHRPASVGGCAAVTATLAAVVARRCACGHVPRRLPADGGSSHKAR